MPQSQQPARRVVITVAKKQNELNFEQSLKELEALVEKMEAGNLSLEESLKYFERGVALTRNCQKALSQAEQKVQILLEKNGKEQLQDFEAEENRK
jgi:exodeoxyribonuclease VII small subunit